MATVDDLKHSAKKIKSAMLPDSVTNEEEGQLFLDVIDLATIVADNLNLGIASFSEKYFDVLNGHVSIKEGIFNTGGSGGDCDFDKYFYEKDGQLWCRFDLVSEKGISARGLGPLDGGGGGASALWQLVDVLDEVKDAVDGSILIKSGSHWTTILQNNLTPDLSGYVTKTEIEKFLHTHENKDVLDAITADRVKAWDAKFDQSSWDSYFYEKDGQLWCKLDFVGEKGISARGLGPLDGGGGGASALWQLVDVLDEVKDAPEDSILIKRGSHWTTILESNLTPDLTGLATKKYVDDSLKAKWTTDIKKLVEWDAAYTATHFHDNKTVLDAITADKVQAWDAKFDQASWNKYFYEKDGQLWCKLDFVDEKGISARGLGPLAGGGSSTVLINNLISDRTDAALTANMGRYLKELIDGKASDWNNIIGKPDFDNTYLKLTGGTLTGDLIGKNISANGLLNLTLNGVTTKIGSQNEAYCHYETNSTHGHWFNMNVVANGDFYGGIGSSNRRLAYIDEIAGIDVNYASYTGRLKGFYTGNGGYQKPNYFGLGGRLQMMLGLPGTTVYHDCFIMNSYISDVPWCNMIAGDKYGYGNFYLYQQDANSETWGLKGKFWHSGNSNLSTVDWNCKELNASGWIRSYGDVGWFSQTYGGGIYMADSTWVQVYNGKKFLVENSSDDSIYTQGGIRTGSCYYTHIGGGYASILSGGNAICISGGADMHVNHLAHGLAPQTWYWKNGTSTGWSDHQFGMIVGHKMAYIDGFSTIGIGGHHVGLKLYESDHTGINIANSHFTWGIYANQDGNMYIGRRNGNVDDSSGAYYYMFGAGLLTVFGNVVATGGLTCRQTSDRRLKTNLRYLDGLSYLRQLQAYEFDYNDTYKQITKKDPVHDYGYIAQDVQCVLPSFVGKMYSSDYLGIETTRLIPILGASIIQIDKKQSEHEKMIQALVMQNKRLTSKVSELESEVKQLRKVA